MSDPLNSPLRPLWLCVGWLCLALGAIGAVLPLLPTTPFVLLSAAAFGRSSPAMQRRLEENRTFGPMIRDWRAHGAIAPRYKALALTMMGAVFAVSVVRGLAPTLLAVQGLCLLGAAAFILTRPGRGRTTTPTPRPNRFP